MKIRIVRLFFAVFLGLFSLMCMADQRESNIDQLIVLSGLKTQVSSFPGQVKAGVLQAASPGGIGEAQVSNILESVDNTIMPAVILREIRSSLAASLNDEETATLLKWYESDVGRRVTTAEEAASTPEAYEEMMQNAQMLTENDRRVQMAMRIDELVGATKMGMEMQDSTSVAIYSAMMAAMAPGQPVDIEAYEKEMEKIEPQIREQVQSLVMVSFLYTYQSISDDDMKKYEIFLSRPTSKKFNDSALSGMARGFDEVVNDLAGELAVIMQSDAA
ncbi:DUF2059 domain-containing protein [uncultured Alcanivorax sp.]|jgi:hypothetical protein|uniref:DUF2059 domain-containing protein n=1 Tax=uncultured Alcanivorax sp. TaxID=191215 RepID=UPI0026366FCC|nr:DUF2059 domain-containing protein [uncultured Alcanivorax sp.]